jgi:hypothetical protein
LPPSACLSATSGHRGTSLAGSFNEAHILAVTQAICEHRRAHDIDGPLYLRQGHATRYPRPAQSTALEVLGGERRRHDHSATTMAVDAERPRSRARSSRTTAAAASISRTVSS